MLPPPQPGTTSDRDQAAAKSTTTAGTETTVSKDLPPTPYRAMPRIQLSMRRTLPQAARKRSHTSADTNAHPELEKHSDNGRPLKKAQPAVTVDDQSPPPRPAASGSTRAHDGISHHRIRLTLAGCPWQGKAPRASRYPRLRRGRGCLRRLVPGRGRRPTVAY